MYDTFATRYLFFECSQPQEAQSMGLARLWPHWVEALDHWLVLRCLLGVREMVCVTPLSEYKIKTKV